MQFLEDLPDQCPPAEAVDSSFSMVYRIVYNNPVSVDDFLSRAAKGQPTPGGVSDCRNASCSLFSHLIKMRAQAKLPKFRGNGTPRIAYLNIQQGAGLAVENPKTQHIDFWGFKSFDPTSAVIKVEDVI